MAFAVLSSPSVKEAERAFELLAREDYDAAKGLAIVLCRAGPAWVTTLTAILGACAPEWSVPFGQRRHLPIIAGLGPPVPFQWGEGDSKDTATKLATNMGWAREMR